MLHGLKRFLLTFIPNMYHYKKYKRYVFIIGLQTHLQKEENGLLLKDSLLIKHVLNVKENRNLTMKKYINDIINTFFNAIIKMKTRLPIILFYTFLLSLSILSIVVMYYWRREALVTVAENVVTTASNYQIRYPNFHPSLPYQPLLVRTKIEFITHMEYQARLLEIIKDLPIELKITIFGVLVFGTAYVWCHILEITGIFPLEEVICQRSPRIY